MTTTDFTPRFQTFTPIQIKSIANKMGVMYYTKSHNYYEMGFGIGIAATSSDDYTIAVKGYERSYSENVHYESKIKTLAWEKFQLKLELWALKNNVNYELSQSEMSGNWFLKILKGTN